MQEKDRLRARRLSNEAMHFLQGGHLRRFLFQRGRRLCSAAHAGKRRQERGVCVRVVRGREDFQSTVDHIEVMPLMPQPPTVSIRERHIDCADKHLSHGSAQSLRDLLCVGAAFHVRARSVASDSHGRHAMLRLGLGNDF